jgi:cell division protein ZapA
MSAKAMPAGTVTLDVSLLGRDYKFSCKEGEEYELKEAVAVLDRRMREIRESGKTISTERVAVMAAVNLAHDYLRERAVPHAAMSPSVVDAHTVQRKIATMQSAIDSVLSAQQKLL